MSFRLVGFAALVASTAAACTGAPPVEPGRYEVSVVDARSHCPSGDPVFLAHESAWSCPLGGFGGGTESPRLASDARDLRCPGHPFGEPTLWDVTVEGDDIRIADLSTDARLAGFADADSVFVRGESPVELIDGSSVVFWDALLTAAPDGSLVGQMTVEIPLNDPMAEHCFVDLDVRAEPLR